MSRLANLLKSRTGPSIVYVTLQRQAQDVCNRLQALRIDAHCYHAGMTAEERERVQLSFMSSQMAVVVATIAFGMGIDKGSCHTVLLEDLSHLSLCSRHQASDPYVHAKIIGRLLVR